MDWRSAAAALVLAFAPCAAASAPPEAARIPYALTISGGISLGAYEAGVNWALLRYLQHEAAREDAGTRVYPDLVAVTGASAGSINALISAITWCIDAQKAGAAFPDTVSKNILFDTWTAVGLDDLLPRGDAARYLKDDGVLTRAAFTAVLQDVARLVGIAEGEAARYRLPLAALRGMPRQAIFKDDCRVSFGFTVTSENLSESSLAGLRVGNQRHFIPLTLTVSGGRAVFRSSDVDPTTPGLGNVIFLRAASGASADDVESGQYPVETGAVLNAVLASSAFPVAFGRRHLGYCRPESTDPAQARAHQSLAPGRRAARRGPRDGAGACPARTEAAQGVFIDGGVFDNVPLGATRALAERGEAEPGRRVTYVYIDPDQRRNGHRFTSPIVAVPHPSRPPANYGLRSQLRFLGGTVETARSYELHKEITTGEWTARVSVKTEEVRALLENHPEFSAQRGTDARAGTCAEFLRESVDRRNPDQGLRGAERGAWLRRTHACLAGSASAYEGVLQRSPAERAELAGQRSAELERLRRIVETLRKADDTYSAPRLRALENSLTRALADPLGDRRLMLSSRFHPIIGEYLYGFGAFFDRSFREFDYYAGVYDAANGIAQTICDIREALGERDCELGEQLRELYRILGVRGSGKADFVFTRLAATEHPQAAAARGEWSWLRAADPGPDGAPLAAVLASLVRPGPDAGLQPSADFAEIVERLQRQPGYFSAARSAYLRDIVANRDLEWWLVPAVPVSRRLEALEDSESESELGRPFGWMADLAESRLRGRSWTSITFHARTPEGPPDEWLRQILPSEAGFGSGTRAAPFVGWEWTARYLSIELPLALHAKQHFLVDADHTNLTQAGARLHASKSGFRAGAGFDLNYRWKPNAENDRHTAWGWSLFLERGCVRVTLGERSINGDIVSRPSDYYLDVGVLFWGACK